MIQSPTLGIISTNTRTRILTFVSNTRSIWWTVRTNDTFWTASLVGVSEIIGQTLAGTGSILLSTNWICSTGTGHARSRLYWYRIAHNRARCESVSDIAGQTNTHWWVTDYSALGVGAALTWTRVLALLINTSEVVRTLSVGHTLWTTVWRRSNIFAETRTWWRVSVWSALCVWSTWRWIAWVDWICWSFD